MAIKYTERCSLIIREIYIKTIITCLYTAVRRAKLKETTSNIRKYGESTGALNNTDKSQNYQGARSKELDKERACMIRLIHIKLKKMSILCSDRKTGQNLPGYWARGQEGQRGLGNFWG